MSFAANPFRRTDLVILLLALALTAVFVAVGGGGFPLDDSWIHQTYGRNLSQTGQWAFVPGQPSAASTSPLYTVLLAAGYVFGVPYALWAHGIGALALALTGMIGARMEETASGDRRVGLAAGLALVTAWHLLWGAASGMETALFSLLTLALIALAWRELTPRSPDSGAIVRRGALFGAVAALTTLARPEGVMLAGFVGLALVIARPNMTWKDVIMWGAAAAVGFAIVLAPYLIYNLQVTGGLLPNTAAAKQMWARPMLAMSYPWRLWQMTLPLLAGGQVLLLPGMIAYLVVMLRRGRLGLIYLLPLAWGLGLIALYAAWLPFPFQHGRYVIPALPALIVCGVIGSARILAWGSGSAPARVLTRVLALSAALMFVVFLVPGLGAYRQDVAIVEEEMVTSARWIAANLPPQELLAIHDIGAVGYFAPRPIFDIAGLVNPEVIPVIPDPEATWALIEAQGARYLLAFPDQVPGDDPTDSRLCPVFTTGGTAALTAGGENMTLFALAWDGVCPP